MRIIPLLSLALLMGSVPVAISPVPCAADPDAAVVSGKQALPGLTLQLLAPRRQYALGEPIEVTMRYTYTGPRALKVLIVTYDRSGRIMDFGFTAQDQRGHPTRDPIGTSWGIMGGIRSSARLTPSEPYSQKAFINEWVAFDRPGQYTVRATSRIVSFDTGDYSGEAVIPLTSQPLKLVITGPNEVQRRALLAEARAAVRSAAAVKPGQEAGTEGARREAVMQRLRFLMDGRAIPLLVQGLNDPFGNVVVQARFGLMSFLDLAPVRAALLKELNGSRPPTLQQSWAYVDLLTRAEMQARGLKAGPEGKEYQAISRRWRDAFVKKTLARLDTLPPPARVSATIEAIAFGTTVAPTPEQWRFILDNIELVDISHRYTAASLIQGQLRDKALIPDLHRLAENKKSNGEVRSAALIALHRMGDDTLRDLIVQDLVSPQPHFTTEAARMLGDYRARDVATQLLALLRQPAPGGDPDRSVAQRILEFGRAATAVELRQALEWQQQHNKYDQQTVLEALAIRSPDTALPFIRDIAHNPEWKDNGLRTDSIRTLLTRMDTPAARDLIRELFYSSVESDRESLAEGFAMAAQDAPNPDAPADPIETPRHLQPAPGLAEHFVPELITMASSDTSAQVRAAARHALTEITGVPKGVSSATPAQQQAWIPLWQAWWAKHRARYEH